MVHAEFECLADLKRVLQGDQRPQLDRIEEVLAMAVDLAEKPYASRDWWAAYPVLQVIYNEGTKLVEQIPSPEVDEKPSPQIEAIVKNLVTVASHFAQTNLRISDIYYAANNNTHDEDSKIYLENSVYANDIAMGWALKFNLGFYAWRQLSNEVTTTRSEALDAPPDKARRTLRLQIVTLLSLRESLSIKMSSSDLPEKDREVCTKALIGCLNNLGVLYTDLAELPVPSELTAPGSITKPLDNKEYNLFQARDCFLQAITATPDLPTKDDDAMPWYIISKAAVLSNLCQVCILEGEINLTKTQARKISPNFEYFKRMLKEFSDYAGQISEIFIQMPSNISEKQKWQATSSFLKTEVYCRFARMLILLGNVRMIVENKKLNLSDNYSGVYEIPAITTISRTVNQYLSRVRNQVNGTKEEISSSQIFDFAGKILENALPKPPEPVDKDDRLIHKKVLSLLSEAWAGKAGNVV